MIVMNKMKSKKTIFSVLAVAGMFVMLMLTSAPANALDDDDKPDGHGDIIFAEAKGLQDIPFAPDHTALWDEYGDQIIEADPYMDKWGGKDWDDSTMGDTYPHDHELLRYLTWHSYNSGNDDWGVVEDQSISEGIWNVENYSKCYYGEVWARDEQPYQAVQFALQKRGKPFDYVSPWLRPYGKNRKQIDEDDSEYPDDYFSYYGDSENLGEGYYCSELTWAAWKRGGNVDLDSDLFKNRVMPGEIKRNIHVTIDPDDIYWL